MECNSTEPSLTPDQYLPTGKSLLPFQRTAVEQMISFLLNNDTHAVYNACEPGLGKTIQTIVTLNILSSLKYIPRTPSILIICPAVMRGTWRRELNAWSIFNKSIFVAEKKILQLGLLGGTVVICSYEGASSNLDVLKHDKWDVLICDEIHYLKTASSKRSKTIFKNYWLNSIYKIGLSGTPFSKNALDGWTVFSRMAPHVFKCWFSYSKKFCIEKWTPRGMMPTGVKNHLTLQTLVYENFMVRFLKKDVLPELPDKVYKTIYLSNREYGVEGKEAEFQEYKELLTQALLNDELEDLPNPPSFSSWKREQGIKKAPAVIAYVKELLEQEIPVLLFGYHKDSITAYAEALNKYAPSVITGDTPAKVRDSQVANFQNGETLLFIGQLKAAGIGITLTRASNVVLGELDYSPDVIAQAVDRAHRIGQKDSVTVHYFVVEDSIDERIAEVVMRKSKDFAKVFNKEAV